MSNRKAAWLLSVPLLAAAVAWAVPADAVEVTTTPESLATVVASSGLDQQAIAVPAVAGRAQQEPSAAVHEQVDETPATDGASPWQEPTDQGKHHAEKVHITFGVYSYQRPADVYRAFSPVIDRLETMAAEELRQPVRMHLSVHRTYEQCLQAFVDGDIDFVRFGPASYVLAKRMNPQIELLAADQEGGKKVCYGVIVVAKNSKIRTLSDLKGVRFAFGDDQSTIGRYLSQAQLVKAGVRAKDLAAFKYLGRHDIVFKAVELGDYDAGALHIDIFEELNRQHQRLRVVHKFENVGKPWLARAGLPPEQVRALRQSLLRLQDSDALQALKISGCMAAADHDYEPVREAMQLSRLFLGEPPEEEPTSVVHDPDCGQPEHGRCARPPSPPAPSRTLPAPSPAPGAGSGR